MADSTEIKSDITLATTEAVAAASSEPTVAPAVSPEPTAVAMSASTEAAPAAPAVSAPEISALKIDAPKIEALKIDAANLGSAKPGSSSETLANVRPGFDFAKLRPDFAKYRPNFSKLAPSRQSMRLAAALGLACGLGLLLGAVGTFGAGHLLGSPHAALAAKSAAVTTTTDETRALQQTVTRMQSHLAALKSSIDRSNKATSSQTAKLSERYDRDAHTQTELQTRLNKIGETVDRLERRVAIALAPPDTTGSVTPQRTSSTTPQRTATPTPIPAPQRVAAAPATTAAAPAAEAKKPASSQIVDGWVVRDVFRGRALVASRNGIFEAAPGLNLPGLGQVESVRRQDGQWVVVTEKGLIVASRGARTHYRLDDD